MTDWDVMNNSPLNSMEEVRREMYLPPKVYLHDNTLRDGEQFPGVEFTKRDKIEIARALSEYGIHRIELMPAVSREDQQAASELNAMGLSAEIVGFCRSVNEDIQKAVDAGCRAIVLEMMAYPPALKALGWSVEDAIRKMIDASHFAKKKGLRITLFFVLIMQSSLDFSREFIRKVLAEAAGDSVGIPDTAGTCLPQAVYHYVRTLRRLTDKPIEIHTHNTCGLGVANALAGVMAGAEVVHGCINGLGEGAGNAALEAVAFTLRLMLGIDSGIRLEKTHELCKLVERLSRVSLQSNWPLVGEKVFTTESGVTVDVWTKMRRAGVAIPGPDFSGVIGRTPEIVVGKMSGRTSVEVKMGQLGLAFPGEEQLKEILERVKNRSIEMHDALSDEEFKKIVSQVVG